MTTSGTSSLAQRGGFPAVLSLADDLEARLRRQDGPKAVTHDLVVVREQNSDAHANPVSLSSSAAVMGAVRTILVPLPGDESIWAISAQTSQPLTDAEQAVPTAGGARIEADTVVLDGNLDMPILPDKSDVGILGLAMLRHVDEQLAQNPKQRNAAGFIERLALPGLLQGDM